MTSRRGRTDSRSLTARAVRRLGFGLPSEVWIVQVGVFLNHFGWAAVFPFEIIYLHNGRGFSLGVSGLIVGTLTGTAVIAAPATGALIDRLGARTSAATSCLALAAGYVGLAFAHSAPQAFACAVVAGIGIGGLFPSQYTLVASLTPPELRHRSTAVMRIASNSATAIGGAMGGIVAAHGLNGFIVLLLANAVTYLLYAVIIVAAVRENARPDPIAGGYRLLLRDRPFVRLALTNIAVTAVGWGVFNWILPTYSLDEIGTSTRLIGLLVTANAITVVLVQIPVAKFAEGRQRTVAMALGALTFVAACLLAAGAAFVGLTYASALLLLAAVVIAIGECVYMTALIPLAADLAPPAIRGRYMATIQLSWWLGMALAPTLGAQLLNVSGVATMLVAAGVALAGALSAASLGRRLPAETRLTPGPKASTPELPAPNTDVIADAPAAEVP